MKEITYDEAKPFIMGTTKYKDGGVLSAKRRHEEMTFGVRQFEDDFGLCLVPSDPGYGKSLQPDVIRKPGKKPILKHVILPGKM